jgi:hypothetical protein
VIDAKCDLLLYGNAERAIVEIAHRLAAREPIEQITDVRGTAFIRKTGDPSAEGWFEIDSTQVDQPGRVDAHINPYLMISEQAREQGASCAREDEAQAVADAENGKGKPIKFVRNAASNGASPHPSPLPEGEGVSQGALAPARNGSPLRSLAPLGRGLG